MKHISEKEEFDALLAGSKPVLADFYAEWCGPCGMIAPLIEEIAREHDEMETVKINVDEAYDLAREYGVSSIPTVVLFQNGGEVDRIVGAVPREKLEQFIAQ